MLALVESRVTQSLLCSQMAHLAHRSMFDESRPGHHGGGNLFRQSPTGHGGRPLWTGGRLRRCLIDTSHSFAAKSHSCLLCGRALSFRVSDDGERAATGQAAYESV